MTTPVPASECLRALATIGLAWTRELAHADIARAVHPSISPADDGLWWPAGPAEPPFLDGLALSEALGLTLAVRWAEQAEGNDLSYGWPLVRRLARSEPRWSVRLPVVTSERTMTADEALPVVRAMLVVRRVVWPRAPWRPRDPIAENLERHARDMEATLRPASPVLIKQPVNRAHPSDLGRDWKGRC
jgi:hypothetical protein